MTESISQQISADEERLASDISSSRMLSDEQILANRISQRALSRWSNLGIDVDPFVSSTLLLLDRTKPVAKALESIMIEDLFLAYACDLNHPQALAAFDQECTIELCALASKFHITPSDLDDIRQTLWNKLFVGTGENRPKISEYRGSGELRNWFRVLAARTILSELRGSRRRANALTEVRDKALVDFVPTTDPELENIRRLYKDTFRAAFEKAVGALQPEERNLLRCSHILGMSTDEIGKAFGIHKATAARQVARARTKLLQLTRDELKDHLGANSGELDSVLRLFDGELSLTLSRLLQ